MEGPSRHRAVALAALAVLVVALLARRHVVQSQYVIYVAVLVPSIILHEVSHGLAALAFGDDTAKRAGRLTLNPLPHIDPVGSVVLPALALVSGFFGIAWAKPVPVDVAKLRRPRDQAVVVALVVPALNVVLALVAAAVLRQLAPASLGEGAALLPRVVLAAGFANVVLAAFNLLPVPPLDGSAVVERLLPRSLWPGYLRLRAVCLPAVFLAVVLFHSWLSAWVFDPALRLWAHLAGG